MAQRMKVKVSLKFQIEHLSASITKALQCRGGRLIKESRLSNLTEPDRSAAP
jgi:hypothetical protein